MTYELNNSSGGPMDKHSNLQAIVRLILISLYPCLSLAQTPESFFPSEVGNLWQYRYDVGTPYSWRITRDSVDAQSSRYLFGATNNFAEGLRYKLDTMHNIYESPISSWHIHTYKLDADSGDAWIWKNNGYTDFYAWVYSITSYPVFGMPKTVKIYRFGPMHPDSGGNAYYYTEQHLASDFGLVFETGEPSYALFLQGCIISGDTFGTIVSVPTEPSTLPEEIMLHQNYPNPFNPTTTIEYEVAERGTVRLKVFDLLGQQVGIVAEGVHERGRYTVRFNGSGLPSGIYLFRIETQRGSVTKRMILLR
jgi:hypothetical protein